MVRTVLYAVYFGLVILLSQFLVLLPYYILRLFGLKKIAKTFIKWGAIATARLVIMGIGAKVRVHGLENLPMDRQRICLVSNHQGIFDVPLIIGYLPLQIAFIAKVELKKVPLLNWWLFAIGAILLDRKSRRSAIEAIRAGVERIKAGQVLAIFPEGTRSRSNRIGSFKPGSLKLAYRSGSVIVPVTIKNCYRLLEEKGRIQPGPVDLYVHEAVDTAGLDEEGQKGLAEQLKTTIAGPLMDES
ncbi:MAG TPA: 1-acyl-sn-glycerol-3-phosphate acyltransferase [Sediminispirochaeta sp.]|nr:1-acyl-sn-glycerol-3-phosphate acyltransferase [Sediminispirochaeta sp.]